VDIVGIRRYLYERQRLV